MALYDVEYYKKHLEIALKAHNKQLTPNNLPYSYHILSVTAELIAAIKEEGLSKKEANIAIACALLHDVLEDTKYKLDGLDKEVVEGVKALSKDSSLPKDKQMKDSLDRLKKQPLYIQMVKIADRITNLDKPPLHWSKDKIKKYAKEARLIKDKLKSPNMYLWNKLDKKIKEYEELYTD